MSPYIALAVAIAVLMLPAFAIGLVVVLVARKSPAPLERGLNTWACALLGLLGGYGIWWALLSWPVGPHGDYAPWQVVLDGLAMIALVVCGTLYSRHFAYGGVACTLGAIFTHCYAWGAWAVIPDETGQSGMGLFLMAIGLQAGLGLVWFPAFLHRWSSAQRKRREALQ